THNFIRGLGNFGVSIGLARGGELVAGVIYMPLENELYRAEMGAGAFRNDTRIHVSGTDTIARCSLCFDSSIRYDPDRITAVLRRVGTRVFNLRMFGSSVRALTYLAEGRVDAAVEFDDRPWDFAAGMALLGEAGGQVHALDGGPLSLDKRGYVASNGLIHKELQAIVSGAA
ncbi:MAG: inositol monophosphatase, partial [Chitinivibrionales bacterium]|nr:inositol monophosphatase [Chitinivibrionales bacterium]